jgi:hypothetical protein
MTKISLSFYFIKKLILIVIGFVFYIFLASPVFAQENNDLPSTLTELDYLIGEGNAYKSALWSPRAEIMVDFESTPTQIKTRDRKSKHFFFTNNYCQIYTEVYDLVENIIIPKGIRYLFREMKISENIPSENGLTTEVFIKISDKAEQINSLDILCVFPSHYLNANSNPQILFKDGLENTIFYLPSILF